VGLVSKSSLHGRQQAIERCIDRGNAA